MSKSEALEELVRIIGLWTYGKERWFPQNGVWYDRYDGNYIDTQELVARIIKAIKDEIAEQTREVNNDNYGTNQTPKEI